MNLLYLRDPHCDCGGKPFVTAIYIQISAVEPHLVIEEQCTDCDRLDTIDIPFSKLQAHAAELAKIPDPTEGNE